MTTQTIKVNGVDTETMIVTGAELEAQDGIIAKDGRVYLLTAIFSAPFGADYTLATVKGMDQARRFPHARKFRIFAR